MILQLNYAANPNLPDPLRGGLMFAGLNGNPVRAANLYVNTWQPRFGLAYSAIRN